MSTVLAEQVITVATPSITFDPVPQTYRNLRIVITGRGTFADVVVGVGVRFNDDAAVGSYALEQLIATSATPQAHETGVPYDFTTGTAAGGAMLSGATATANFASGGVIDILNYRGAMFKQVNAPGGYIYSLGGSARAVGDAASWWLKTAAITKILLFTQRGSFAVGTVATLYGLRRLS